MSTELVCPRCGTTAEKHRSCPKCGLPFFEQPELPNRERWEREVLAAAAAFAREEKGSLPLRRPALSWSELPNRGKVIVASSVALFLVLGVVWLLGRADWGDGAGTSPESRARAVERALSEETLQGDFPQLASARNIACQPHAEYRGRESFICNWTLESGEQGGGTWVLEKGQAVARVSEGGSYGGPPTDLKEASKRVTAVVQQRGAGSAACRKSKGTGRPGSSRGVTYSCAVFDRTGGPIIVDGEQTRAIWRWNEDGTVGGETIGAHNARTSAKNRSTS